MSAICASNRNIGLVVGYGVATASLITALVLTILKAKVGVQAAMYSVGGATLGATLLVRLCTRNKEAAHQPVATSEPVIVRTIEPITHDDLTGINVSEERFRQLGDNSIVTGKS